MLGWMKRLLGKIWFLWLLGMVILWGSLYWATHSWPTVLYGWIMWTLAMGWAGRTTGSVTHATELWT